MEETNNDHDKGKPGQRTDSPFWVGIPEKLARVLVRGDTWFALGLKPSIDRRMWKMPARRPELGWRSMALTDTNSFGTLGGPNHARQLKGKSL